ncbi:MAG: hypothetical protein LAO24_07310 [Acidobacteriia bacterium]|nr:hypothetical protein [Terriglobia bacterium]
MLEGNRRLAALKSLENPESLIGALQPNDLTEMRKWSKQYQENPIESLQCFVVETKPESQHWMELRHTGGQNEGAAIVPWGADDAARFRARSGNIPFHTQALDLLENRGDLTPDKRKKVKSASLKRIIGTPEVREKLGIELEDGKLKLLADERHVAKALLHVVNDLISGAVTTKDIYHKPQRIDYANKLPAAIVVKPTIASGHGVAVSAKGGKPTAPKATVGSGPVIHKDRLMPRGLVLNITDPRLQRIAKELKTLSLIEYTNAVSVLFRVFIELSADDYIGRQKLTPANDKLSTKLLAVTQDLIARKKLTTAQAAPVRLTCRKDSFLAPSTALMNEYVHNKFIFPAPGDLRAYWDSVQSFVQAVWAP